MHGINLDAGIFLSYIGLFSFYNFDNWAYQPSFVSSNTPWFFNGVRGQFYPTQHLKIEPWFINGWQSYARFGTKPGLGGQIKWTPTTSINIISNNYGYGEDDFGIHGRTRFHTDNSFELKYYDHPDNKLDRMAFSLTADAGCESGSGVACTGSADHKIVTPATSTTPAVYYQKQSFLGWMLYNRFWFDKDKYGLTLGGGQINNPGRYLVLLPPINGATAVTGTAYFPEDPGQPFHGTDGTITYDYMPTQYITFRSEYSYRHSDVPYWAGRGGSTPPGGNTYTAIGSPADFTCTNGSTSADSGLGYTTMPGLKYNAGVRRQHRRCQSRVRRKSELPHSLASRHASRPADHHLRHSGQVLTDGRDALTFEVRSLPHGLVATPITRHPSLWFSYEILIPALATRPFYWGRLRTGL